MNSIFINIGNEIFSVNIDSNCWRNTSGINFCFSQGFQEYGLMNFWNAILWNVLYILFLNCSDFREFFSWINSKSFFWWGSFADRYIFNSSNFDFCQVWYFGRSIIQVLNLDYNIERLGPPKIWLIFFWNWIIRNVTFALNFNNNNIFNIFRWMNNFFLVSAGNFVDWNILYSTDELFFKRFIRVWLKEFLFNLNNNRFGFSQLFRN